MRGNIARIVTTGQRANAARCNHEKRDGAGDRIRTDDLLFTKQLLCQLSYAGWARYGRRAPSRRVF